MLTAEELLAGSALTFEVEVPPEILRPAGAGPEKEPMSVRLRPLTVRDLQLVARAAKENDALVAALMVQRALVAPELTAAQVSGLPAGLVEYLLEEINRISGITASAEQISEARRSPLVKAAYVLAKEFGWTPEQVGQLTLGQVLLHLEMLRGKNQK